MATLSSLGVGAGFDTESVVSKLVALEKAPARKIQSDNSKLNTKLSTWGRVQSAFSTLRDTAAALSRADFWRATTASSSDAAAVSVTTGNNTPAGSYSIRVNALATSQFVGSGAFAGKASPVGEGTLRISLGTYESDGGEPPAITFAAKAAAQAIEIEIGPGDNTLEKIRDRINSANAGVTAALITDAAGTRLVMRGPSGASNAFKVEVTEGASPGLSALAYDASTGGASSMTRTQSASNAQATINGLNVSSETNSFSDVLDGMSLQVSKVTASPVEVTVAQDTAAMRKGIDDFVGAYNSLVGLIRVQTLYDEASKTAGPLQGDSTATGLLSQIRRMASTSTSATSAFERLSDVGLELNKEGTLRVNSTKLQSAMGKLPELARFFSNSDDGNPAANGIAQRFREIAAKVVGSDGAISTRTDGLRATIKRNDEKISRLEDRVALIEARLRKQYTALDTNMGNLTALQSYVSQQLAQLNKTS
jgi:flagellar hook-associated protein 2